MRLRAAMLVMLLGLGCETRLSIGSLRERAVPDDGGQHDAGQVDAGLCGRKGALYDVGDGAGVPCTDGVRRAFRNALCSCGDLQSNAPLSVDAFDSAESAYEEGDSNGSIGVNGAFYPISTSIGGSAWVHGSNGIPLNGELEIGGNLHDQGQLDGAYSVTVDGDAYVLGPVHVNSISAKTLTVSPTSTVMTVDPPPPFTQKAVVLPVPCDCTRPPLDIAALVNAHATDNDNAALGLDAKESFRSINGSVELTLPCGRYYAEAFYAPNPITLTISGPVELYVKGSMVTDGPGTIDIQFTAGGEIDLFVEKGFSTKGHVQIGWPTAPARTRVYAGGGDTLFFGGITTLGASLYAPEGELVTNGSFEVFGAMLVGRVSAGGSVALHYDRELARDSCTPGSCTDSASCGVLSCKNKACVACKTAADCGPFLRCDRGLCLP
jgi:hypothetical protein